MRDVDVELGGGVNQHLEHVFPRHFLNITFELVSECGTWFIVGTLI